MEIEIVPEPSPAERAAILAALELERVERETPAAELTDEDDE